MTPALAAAAPSLFDPEKLERPGDRLTLGQPLERTGDRLTLEQRLDRVREGLLATGAAACPLCDGLMTPAGGGAGRCGGCGSALA